MTGAPALGFDWANRHRDAVKGIAYLEAIVRPSTWSDFPEPARPMFEALRSPAGEAVLLEQNMFVEQAVPPPMPSPRARCRSCRSRANPGAILSRARPWSSVEVRQIRKRSA